ncbi:hypothetical protein B0H13DRAFT_1872254 [Mycena leptocephala]|nr:hypothetical protein B0H13DRAFT_1872254 [Mycena leptocephala]
MPPKDWSTRRASNAGIDADGDRGGYVWGAGDGIVSELPRRLRRGRAAARRRDRRKWRKGIWPRMERASHRTNGAHPSSDKVLPRSPARYQRIRERSAIVARSCVEHHLRPHIGRLHRQGWMNVVRAGQTSGGWAGEEDARRDLHEDARAEHDEERVKWGRLSVQPPKALDEEEGKRQRGGVDRLALLAFLVRRRLSILQPDA